MQNVFEFSVFSSGGLTSLSPSSRDSVDPIAELLSQLSGVRRSTSNTNSSTPNQLQQLQMQLQLERQQVSAARQQLERLPRRQNQSQTLFRETASPGYSVLINPSSGSTHSVASAPPTSSNSNFLLDTLFDELNLQSVSDEVWQDRSSFAEELLVATLVNRKPEASETASAASTSAAISNQAEAVESVEPTRPAASTNRVLRGRARSDNHNASRRADANKNMEYKNKDNKNVNKNCVSKVSTIPR